MHRCLYIHEILLMVARNLDDSSLCHMALTCRAFHGPAIEKIWERLPGLRPLLSLLPEDAHETAPAHDLSEGYDMAISPDALMITRIPQEEEWARVQQFARCVRDLVIPSHTVASPYLVSLDAMFIVDSHYPDLILLPNLRRLYVEDRNLDPYVQILESPRLESVEFTRDNSSLTMALSGVLDSTEICSLLELHIGTEDEYVYGHGVEWRATVDALSRVVLRQTRIESLVIPSHVSEQALIHLAHSPFLRRLEIDFYTTTYQGTLQRSPANFSSLTDLNLTAMWCDEGLEPLTSFINVLPQPSPLKTFGLLFDTSSSGASLPDLFAAVSRLTSLTHCTLWVGGENWYWDDEPISADILEPLYRIEGMRVINFSQLPMDVSPTSIHKMAAAWPNIERLHLGQIHSQFTRRLTIEDIAPLATEDCPFLRILGATFVSDARSDWVAPSTTYRPRKRETVLDVGVSDLRLQEAPRIAAVLAVLLPEGIVTGTPFRPSKEHPAVHQINDMKSALLAETV